MHTRTQLRNQHPHSGRLWTLDPCPPPTALSIPLVGQFFASHTHPRATRFCRLRMPPVRTATMVLALVATQACCSAAFRPAFTGLAQRSSSRAISVAHRALFSTAADSASEKKPVPVTLLSGFLGTGKTTALKHLLENRDGVKIGVVVNDVASVNIDAKLMSNPGNDGEANGVLTDDMTIELQNGCACCSLADELLTSMEALMTGRDFDAVVVELSGVADPVSVQQNWEQAKMVSIFECLERMIF